MDFEAYYPVKNQYGKFSNGRMVSSIEFINKKLAIVTTNDSRIRLLDMGNGSTLVKYKGHSYEKINKIVKSYYE